MKAANRKMDSQRIGATMKYLRELRGFRPGEFANEIGITVMHLHNLESGRRNMTNVILARAAKALEVPQIAIMRPREDQPEITDGFLAAS